MSICEYVKKHNTKIKRLDSNIESKLSNNTYLNIIKILKKLFKKNYFCCLLFSATAATAAIVAV